jgi:putative drug exporter of the RND superfamily
MSDVGTGGPGLGIDKHGQPQPAALARTYAWVVAGPLAYLIPIAWIVLAFWVTYHLPSIAASQAALGDLTAPNAPAIAAERLDARLFGVPALSRVAVVQHDPAGLSANVLQAAASQAAAVDNHSSVAGSAVPQGLLGALPIVDQPGLVPASKQTGTTAITYLLFDPSLDWNAQVADAQAYAAALARTPGSSVVGVGGVIPARLQQGDAILNRLTLVELATVVLIALIVGITFRSFGAPFVTLAAGVVSYLVAVRVVAWFGQRTGIAAPQELQPLMIVLLLGIVTDYSIFFLSGFRRHLVADLHRGAAARATTAEFLPTIVAAGVMVAAGTACLTVASLRFFRAFGPGMALTVLIGLVVAITLVPALLAIFGRAVFWPHAVSAGPLERARTPLETTDRSQGLGFAHFASRRPVGVIVTLVSVALLVFASTYARHAHLGFGLTAGLPASSEPARAASAASAGFAPGILSPTEVIVQKAGIGTQRVSLVALETQLSHQPAVAGVIGPREQYLGSALASGKASAGAAGGSPNGLTISKDGSAARFLVIYGIDPLGSKGIASYQDMNHAMPALLARTGLAGARVFYAGDTALAQQTLARTLSDLRRVALAVVVVELFLLVVFLRALIAPLYLMAASILALTASFGLTTYVFQHFFHQPDIVYFVPFAGAVLLISLGSDYNIFLVGRIWEQARIRPMRRAVAEAVPRAARAISVAALALAFSFAALALVDLQSFHQLAFLLVVGVLIDAFIVRALLVPALVTVFGRASAWPGRLRPRGGKPRGDAVEPTRRAT